MTSAELDAKIAETMETLRSDNVAKAIREAWKDYSDELKEEARKKKTKGESLAHAIDRLSDMYPCEMYCYIMFDDEGDLDGWTIDHCQYWQGHGGPTSCISIGPKPDYQDIEDEIGNDLYQALEIED